MKNDTEEKDAGGRHGPKSNGAAARRPSIHVIFWA